MSTLADLEPPVAVCYLYRADDERNRCSLTTKHLLVTAKGKQHVFALAHIKRVALEQRRAWFPLIIGGIIAPLSLIALLLNLYNPWVVLYIFLPSLLLLYWGWVPYSVLAVHDAVKPHDFRLPGVSANLQAFVRFVNRMSLAGNHRIYHVARANDWARAPTNGQYAPESITQEGFIHASQADQLEQLKRSGLFGADTEWVVLTIDPLLISSEIKYEPAQHEGASAELFPHIYGPLNTDAVVEVKVLNV